MLADDEAFGLKWSDFNVKLVSVHDNWRKNHLSNNSDTTEKEDAKN